MISPVLFPFKGGQSETFYQSFWVILWGFSTDAWIYLFKPCSDMQDQWVRYDHSCPWLGISNSVLSNNHRLPNRALAASSKNHWLTIVFVCDLLQYMSLTDPPILQSRSQAKCFILQNSNWTMEFSLRAILWNGNRKVAQRNLPIPHNKKTNPEEPPHSSVVINM